jgi:nitroreductase
MEAIQTRRSVRHYQNKPVEHEKLNIILEAGRLAPSAKNLQEWCYIIVRDFELRQKLMQAAKGQRFVGEAPVVVACCAETNNDYRMSCGQLAYPIDVAISIDHMTLAAVEQGLGTCWVGAFYENEVKKILKTPPEIRVVELLTLGYAADTPRRKIRKPIEDMVKHECWTDQ